MEPSGTFVRYVLLAEKNLRYNCLPGLFAAASLLFILPVLFGLRELSAQEAAAPMELGLSLLGIILITPAFTPETEEGIRDTTAAKYTSYLSVCVLRILCGAIMAACLTGIFIGLMRAGGCEAGLSSFFGTLSNIVFLGGIGLLSHAATNQGVAGYMVPAMYYAFNLSSAKSQLGPFYLFSMMSGERDGKTALFLVGSAAIAAALIVRKERMKWG